MNVVVATEEVRDVIARQGGRLFVWTDPRRCCSGGITYLRAGATPAAGHDFRRIEADGIELWFSSGSLTDPAELHLDVKGRRRKRVEAYWNGCVFVV